ncbi:hypothetical protein DSO57_1002983 [Entomophthora muscae]|uniref:Uncharacterized protein n=1 Tax=Entomophthora muscae TaxID=34485 RepID=A0ACC2U6X3_9FUNG|nr:hypothetical protein DSO57_1002983 [Entomophthora muscae]
MHLGFIQILVHDQEILVSNQQTFLQVLYSELGNTFTTVNQYFAEVTNAQNTMLHCVNAIERGIAKLVPAHLVQTLTHQGVDINWISVVKNHVLMTGPMVQSLTHEVEVLSCHLATIPSFNPTPAAMNNSPSSHLLGRCCVWLLGMTSRRKQQESL